MTTLLASSNAGKLRELLPYFPELGLRLPDTLPEVDETEPTFEGNARLKAEALCAATGLPTLADDSGLCVDALEGGPGVRSARYAPTTEQRNTKLLAALAGVAPARRTARFVCALALARPGEPTLVVTGTVEGLIAAAPAGTNGFGYDPLFCLPDLGRTMAELTAEEKRQKSHRGRAIAALRRALDLPDAPS